MFFLYIHNIIIRRITITAIAVIAVGVGGVGGVDGVDGVVGSIVVGGDGGGTFGFLVVGIVVTIH